MILKKSSKLAEIDENLMKSIHHFASKVINAKSKASLGFSKMILINIDVPQSNRNNFCFMRFSSKRTFEGHIAGFPLIKVLLATTATVSAHYFDYRRACLNF